MSNQPLVSVLIPNYNGARHLESCLRSLLRQSYQKMEIVVVDNASQDQSVRIVQSIAPQAVILRQEQNLGFAGGVDAGVRASGGEWVAVLNNDTEVAADWLSECVSAIRRHPDAAFLATRILDFHNRGRLYSAGDCFLRAGVGYRRGQELPDRPEYLKECEVFSASGCAALYLKSVLKETGGFDKRFFAYLEDVDLGLRLQAAGYRGYYVPGAEVYHHGGATSGGEFSSLAVRLRTRNSLLLLLKNMPARILWSCLPMIFLAQLSWLARAAAHGKFVSYVRGVGGAFLLTPAMLKERARNRRFWRDSTRGFWQRILQSESVARKDFTSDSPGTVSLFLKCYFKLFRGSTKRPAVGSGE